MDFNAFLNFLDNFSDYEISLNIIDGGYNLLFFNKINKNLEFIATLQIDKNSQTLNFISSYAPLINVEID